MSTSRRQSPVWSACGLLPRQPGIYRFRDLRGRVIYLGRASDLRSRTRSYWGDLDGRQHLRRMVPRIAKVEAVVCASVHEAMWLERNILERSKPRWNRVVGGQEVPRWLVVDARRDRPGIRLTHEPEIGRVSYGPYLGGDRSRLALRAILRVWPLHLTGTRGTGSERALARARGLEPGHRNTILSDIGQLLDRDRTAAEKLAGRLISVRDDAVAGLRFETAQQIQDELTAVAWLVSPQRVTACHPAGLVVCGWSAGVLLSLSGSSLSSTCPDGTTRGLDRWEQRRVGAERGQALARSTPPEWREFATRNAELAAELADAQGATAPTRHSGVS